MHSDYHPGTFLSEGTIANGTTIVTITDVNKVTMSATAAIDTFTCAFSEAITGLEVLTFDGENTNIMLAKGADKIYESALTDVTGTFSELKAGLSHDDDATLQSIAVKNHHVILTGKDIPRIVYYGDDDTNGSVVKERALGMLPVPDAAFYGAARIAGTWPDEDTGFGPGYYHFIITEAAYFDEVLVEGTYEGDASIVHITDETAQGIRVTYNATANQPINDGLYGKNLATHWRIYMGPRQTQFNAEVPFSEYTLVSEVPMSITSVDLNNDNPHHKGFAAGLDAVVAGNTEPLFPNSSTNALSSQATFASAETCTLTVNNSQITTINAAFANVTPGMFVFSPNNRLDSGTRVIEATDNSITVNPVPNEGGTETLTFGNSSSIDYLKALCPDNSASDKYRSGFFHSFGLADTIGSFSGATITGIKVEIVGNRKSASPGIYAITVFKNGIAGTQGSTFTRYFGDPNSPSRDIMVAGGENELWGTTWQSTDFADTNAKFGIKVTKQHSAFNNEDEINGVVVTVYAGFNSINYDGDPFPALTITDQIGATTAVPANGPPPVPSTGDIFNGILILNDTAEESIIAGSLPDSEEAFPSLYRIPIQSQDKDKVKVIKKLGNVCIIGMENSIKRLNYFPLETDPDFSQGRAYEDIATDHGMVGPRAATLLDLPGRGTVLAYLSHKGLYWTDGITSMPLNTDIDWENLFADSIIDRSVLTVYPKLHLLVLNYAPSGATSKTKALYLSYNPTHVKQGFQLPATGPVDVRAESAADALVSGVSYLFTGHAYDGKVYLEDSGVQDEYNAVPVPSIKTRRYFIGRALGYQGRVNHVHMLVDASGDATTGAFTGTLGVQSEGYAYGTQDTVTGDTETGGIIQLWGEVFGDTFDFALTQTNVTLALRLHLIGFDIQSYRDSNS
jgi:hypothetical protein